MRILDAHKAPHEYAHIFQESSDMTSTPRRSVPKMAANVSIRRDVLKSAKDAKLNLSATLEQALVEKLKEREREQWRADNREAIKAYNGFVEQHGVFSDGLRNF